MRIEICGAVCALFVVALCEVQAASQEQIDMYRCPFRIFNAGQPALLDNGEIMFCDKDGVQCPSMHFCSAGYPDGRAVCCHILGP